MTQFYDYFWKDMKNQTRLMRISIPHFKEKIFYTFDSSENRISIFHSKEGEFSLSKLDFEKIDKKVKKLLEVDSSYDQFYLLSTVEICAYSIIKNHKNMKNREASWLEV